MFFQVEERNDEGLKMKVGGYRSFFLNSKENRKPLPTAIIKALLPTEKEQKTNIKDDKKKAETAKKDAAPAPAAEKKEAAAPAPAAAAAPPPEASAPAAAPAPSAPAPAAASAPAPAAAAPPPPPTAAGKPFLL